jgi:hypothetical protein
VRFENKIILVSTSKEVTKMAAVSKGKKQGKPKFPGERKTKPSSSRHTEKTRQKFAMVA